MKATALVGQIVDGRWLLVDHIGSGAFGEVFSAEPRHLDLGAGAVKLLSPQNEAERTRILREIQALADLNHDGLVGYRDAGEIHVGALAGTIYIVTELCDSTLADEPGWGTGGRELQSELATAVLQVAAALTYLHEREIVHRDVKPANILRTGQTWKLSDFGLVHRPSAPAGAAIEGTAPYLAPEVGSGDGISPATDIYALGVVVHEALTGTWPYKPATNRWKGPPLREGATVDLELSVPEPWRPLIELSLLEDPTTRPAAAEISALVPRVAMEPPIQGPPLMPSRTSSVATLLPRRGPSRPTKIVAAALIAVALAIAAIVLALALSDGGVAETSAADVGGSTPANADSLDAEADDGVGSSLEPSRDVPTTRLADDGVLEVLGDLTLASDLSAPMRVMADEITVDCDGHAIDRQNTQSDAFAAIAVEGRREVTIRNCRLVGFSIGMFVDSDSSGVVLTDSVAERNVDGFVVHGTTVTLTGNEARGNAVNGFELSPPSGAADISLLDNSAHDNGQVGFFLSGFGGAELRSNRGADNVAGNFVLHDAHDNLLVDNLAEGTGHGFSLDRVQDSVLRNNTAIGLFLGDGTQRGFELSLSSGNVLADNLASGYRKGFVVHPSSTNNHLASNLADRNVEGFSDERSPTTSNTFENNVCTSNDVGSATAGLCTVE